jgi:hypothetical protein
MCIGSMSMSPCPCLHVRISMSPFLHASMSHVYVSMFLSLHASTVLENGNFCVFVANGMVTTVCLLPTKTKKVNFRFFGFFAANGNGKRKFVFLGQKMINGNQQLLFLQTCPSMITTPLGVTFNKLR